MRVAKVYNEQIAEQWRKRISELNSEILSRPRRPILGVRVSIDWGKTWKLYAICDECCRNIEPPTQRRKEGEAGARTCDWCGAVNAKY
ncbi:MAG TPA: hypothetical protein VIL74_20775 [Pyrinomonadaceae bacterium]|jgi:hypothetical protein